MVLALSVATFLSARPLIRILFWVAVLVQFFSLLVASVIGLPADGVPLTFSAVEQSILLASEYFYLLSLLALVRNRPWRGMRWKGWRALIAAPAFQMVEQGEQGGAELGQAIRRLMHWKGWHALRVTLKLRIDEQEEQGGEEPWRALRRLMHWKGWRAFRVALKLRIDQQEEQGGAKPGLAPLPARSVAEEHPDSHRGGEPLR